MSTTPTWRDEVVSAAKKWPGSFRADFKSGSWRLNGASIPVQKEFEQSAERIRRELGYLSADDDPVTSLLRRLRAHGSRVRASQRLKTQQLGSTRITVKDQHFGVHGLGNALVNYLMQPNAGWHVRSRTTRAGAQVAAAEKNRTRAARMSIVRALQSLGPRVCGIWPDFVVAFIKNETPQTENKQTASAEPFQPPDYDRLNQSPADWARMADAAWRKHRDAFLRRCEFWERAGVDEEIPPVIRLRGAGLAARKSERGANSAVDHRYVWAAKYLLGFRVKAIAADDLADASTVGRIARQILEEADWSRLRNTNE
jgi:hypothetical protein